MQRPCDGGADFVVSADHPGGVQVRVAARRGVTRVTHSGTVVNKVGQESTETDHSRPGSGPTRAEDEGNAVYAEERQHALAQLVGQRGRLSVTAAAEQFGVTSETVRRDLAVLEQAGLLRRVHGGAVPISSVALVELALGERMQQLTEQKARIVKAALDFLPGTNGSCILDGGTTTAALAEILPTDRQLLVVTDAVPIAARLASAPGISVHMLGGRVRGVTQCAVGDETTRVLAELRVDVAFMGTNGITAEHGFSTPDAAEAAVKRAMVAAGQRVVVLADSTKLRQETLVRFARPADVDVLITDDGAEPEALTALEAAGVEVVVA
jgi:DeoR family transcriptional regulator, fructose operon transcriptional repressor